MYRHDVRLIRAIHRYQAGRAGAGSLAWLRCQIGKAGHLLWSILSGSDIHRDAVIAVDTRFPHLTGVVVHQDTKIANGCLIMQQVTLGQLSKPGAPVLCEGVYVGAGAKVLGPVRIGRNARIGANAVVLQDVPEGATAVGVPARITARG